MNNYLIRTPIFPLEDLYIFYNNENPNDFILKLFNDNLIFKESIYIYSKILYYEALKYKNISDKKKKTKVANSLIRYFLRMCYRPTPFGLCAGVSIAEFNSLNNEQIEYCYRSIRIDSSIINNIINEINSISEVREHLIYYKNNTLFEKNGYYKFLEKKQLVNSFDFSLAKVDENSIISSILEVGREGIKLNQIREILKIEDAFEEKEINEFLVDIIDMQLIVSELYYDVLNINFQSDFIEKLKDLNLKIKHKIIDEIIALLNTVNNLIIEIKKIDIKSNEDCLAKIIEIDSLLNKYNHNEKTALQIDLIGNTNFSLNESVRNEIEKKLNSFFKLNSFLTKESKLSKFKEEFINRYGNKSVPLLEALDLETGLGYPINLFVEDNSGFLNNFDIASKLAISNRSFSKWDEFILEKYENFLKDETNVIKINSKDLDFINNLNYKKNDSILFSGQIIKSNNNNYNYFVNTIRVGAAQYSAGRFSYGENKIQEFVKDIVEHEKKELDKNSIYAEIKNFSQPRLGNISSRTCFYDYYISIYDSTSNITEKEIDLSDLLLCVKDGIVVLYSKKLNKRVIPKLSCAQNTSLLTCSLYNFLGELSDDYFINFWSWGFLQNKFHLPRVMMDNFIISKERWVLTVKLIYSNTNDITILKNFISAKKINRYVTLTVGGDNFIPLDLYSNISISILNDELLKNGIVILEESLSLGNSNTIVTNQKNEVNSEVNIPILLKNNVIENPEERSIKFKNSKNGIICRQNKMLPSKECLYFKIYIKNNYIDKIIINKFDYLLSKLIEKNAIDSFFFIRYIDPDYHFRIRFFSTALDINSILNELNDVFKEEIASSIIDKIQIDTYEPEIERYGGDVGMDISEKIFHYDSLYVIKILCWVDANNFANEKWLIAMQGVNCLFNDFSIILEERILVLAKLRDYYYNTISNKSNLNKQILSFFNMNKEKIEFNMIYVNFENKFFTYFKDRSIKNELMKNELMKNNIDYDIGNYIHMFLNRFFESNQNQQEMIIYDLLIRYYKSLLFRKN